MFNTNIMAAKQLRSSIYALYTTIAVPVRKHSISGAIARLQKNRSLNNVTKDAKALVKNEDALDAKNA